MKPTLFAASLLALSAVPAVAADPDSAKAAVDPAAVDEAIQMLEAQQFEQQLLGTADVSVEAMLAVQIERLQQETEEPIPAELLESFRQTMREHVTATMKAKLPQIKREAAEIYAREFSPAELRRMREISTDPVMVKSRAKSQTLSAQLMMIGVHAMRESEGQLKAKIERLVEDYLKEAGLATDDKS